MFFEELLKSSYLKEEEVTQDEIVILPAGAKTGMDYNLVVKRADFEQVMVNYRATEPLSEAILMAIGKASGKADPVWTTLAQNVQVIDYYTKLCSDKYADQLNELEKQNPQFTPPSYGVYQHTTSAAGSNEVSGSAARYYSSLDSGFVPPQPPTPTEEQEAPNVVQAQEAETPATPFAEETHTATPVVGPGVGEAPQPPADEEVESTSTSTEGQREEKDDGQTADYEVESVGTPEEEEEEPTSGDPLKAFVRNIQSEKHPEVGSPTSGASELSAPDFGYQPPADGPADTAETAEFVPPTDSGAASTVEGDVESSGLSGLAGGNIPEEGEVPIEVNFGPSTDSYGELPSPPAGSMEAPEFGVASGEMPAEFVPPAENPTVDSSDEYIPPDEVQPADTSYPPSEVPTEASAEYQSPAEEHAEEHQSPATEPSETCQSSLEELLRGYQSPFESAQDTEGQVKEKAALRADADEVFADATTTFAQFGFCRICKVAKKNPDAVMQEVIDGIPEAETIWFDKSIVTTTQADAAAIKVLDAMKPAVYEYIDNGEFEKARALVKTLTIILYEE